MMDVVYKIILTMCNISILVFNQSKPVLRILHKKVYNKMYQFVFFQVVAKPAVRVTAGPSSHLVKMEIDEQTAQKRKRDDDDYET